MIISKFYFFSNNHSIFKTSFQLLVIFISVLFFIRAHHPDNLFANKERFHEFVKHKHVKTSLLPFVSFNSPSEDQSDGSLNISVGLLKHLIIKFLFELADHFLYFLFINIFRKVWEIVMSKSYFIYIKSFLHMFFEFIAWEFFASVEYYFFNLVKYT